MNRVKKIITLIIATILTLNITTPALAQSISNEKEEVVYALLNNEGKTKSVYVVNSFDNLSDGLVDYGTYETIRNLSTEETLKNVDGTVTGASSDEKFYYEGKMPSAELPWNIDITYTIDGKTITAKELAGMEGELIISIKISENPKANTMFYENYALQVSMQLDTNRCQNIVAEGATISNIGENKNISFTLLPGNDVTYNIAAEVQNFEMSSISLNGVLFEMNIDLSGTEDLTSGITDLTDGIATLDDAATQLQKGAKDLDEGVNTLNSKSKDLVNGSNEILNAINQINKAVASIGELTAETGGISQLQDASKLYLTQINDLATKCETLPQSSQSILTGIENSANGLSAIASDDAAMDTLLFNLAAMKDPNVNALIKAYKTKMGVVSTVTTGLTSLKSQYNQFNNAIGNISSATKALANGYQQIDTGLDTIYIGLSGLSELSAAVNTLAGQYKQFNNGMIEYTDGYEQIASGYSDINKGIMDLTSGIAKLRENTKDLDKEMNTKLEEALSGFQGKDYKPVSFVSSENTKVSSVQFVMKTDAIQIAEQIAVIEEEPKKESFWEKLIGLFK